MAAVRGIQGFFEPPKAAVGYAKNRPAPWGDRQKRRSRRCSSSTILSTASRRRRVLISTDHRFAVVPGRSQHRRQMAKLELSASPRRLTLSRAQVKLPSGEVRMILLECRATIGEIGNLDHENISLGKAGRACWSGRRPHVRGVAMNPVDHPLGGGEGKSSGGRHPVTPWGFPTKGYRTRRSKISDKFIVKRRK